MKTTLYQPSLGLVEEDYFNAPLYVTRGQVLIGVLDGSESTEITKVYTDTSSTDIEAEISYQPELDSRIDKFDALEYGYELLDSSSKSSTTQETEEKE